MGLSDPARLPPIASIQRGLPRFLDSCQCAARDLNPAGRFFAPYAVKKRAPRLGRYRGDLEGVLKDQTIDEYNGVASTEHWSSYMSQFPTLLKKALLVTIVVL